MERRCCCCYMHVAATFKVKVSFSSTQQSFLEQTLHIPSAVENRVHGYGRVIDAIKDPVWFKSNLPELRNADVLQLWRNVTP